MKSGVRWTDSEALRTAGLLVLLVAVATLLRVPGFYLPRNHGDQVKYIALARQLDRFGFSRYNLRGLSVVPDERRLFLQVYEGPLPAEKINLLAGTLPLVLEQPLFHKPPLFKYALVAAHRLLASGRPYRAVFANLGPRVLHVRPAQFFREQLYCTIVPFLCSLFFLITVFFLGRVLFSPLTGWAAAMLVCVSPIELLCSQRVWTDDMLAMFVCLALLFYTLSQASGRVRWAVLSGLCAGAAILTKPSGVIVAGVVVVCELCRYGMTRTGETKEDQRSVVARMLSFFVPFILCGAPWYTALLRQYGTMWYAPPAMAPDAVKENWFHQVVLQRPRSLYVINVVCQNPLLIFAYYPVIDLCRHFRAYSLRYRQAIVFLTVWVAAFLVSFYFFKFSVELRYLLPAYPAIALLAAQGGALFLRRIHFASSPGIRVAVWAVIAASVTWSVLVGTACVFSNAVLIRLPY